MSTLPALPAVLRGALQLRSFDGRTFKLRLTNVGDAADANIELVCADGWEKGLVTFPTRHPISVVGARAEPHASHLPPWRLVLDASAPDGALVTAEINGKRLELTRDGFRAIDLFGAADAAGPACTVAAAEGAGGAAPRYTYTPIAELERRQFWPNGKVMLERNVYGVVVDYSPPVKTRGADHMSSLRIVDPTCATSDEGLQLNLFKAHAYVPHVGAVVRVHRCQVQFKSAAGDAPAPRFASNTPAGRGAAGTTTSVHCLAIYDDRAAGRPQAKAFVVAGPGAGSDGAGPPAPVHVDAYDSGRVLELQRWSQALLSDSARASAFLTTRQYQRTLSEVRWQLEAEGGAEFVDLVCRVDSLSAHPPATHPRAQPCGTLTDGTLARIPACSEPARSVDLWLENASGSRAFAQAAPMLQQLQLAGRAMADEGLELWVRARSVRVFASLGPPRRPTAVLGNYSKLTVLPEHHVDVQAARARLAAAAAASATERRLLLPPPPPPLAAPGGARVPTPIAPGSATSHQHAAVAPASSLGALLHERSACSRWRVQARVAAVLPDSPLDIARARCAGCGEPCARVAAPLAPAAALAGWACAACGERGPADVRWEYRASLILEDSACVLTVLVCGEQARALFAPESAAGRDAETAAAAQPCAQHLAARVGALRRGPLLDLCVQSYEHKRALRYSPDEEVRCARVRHFQLFDTVLAQPGLASSQLCATTAN